MKAALATAYGGPEVMRIADVPTPSPKPDELLVRIHASAVNAADWRLRSANPWFVRLAFGPFKPRRPILGVVFAGDVVATGERASTYRNGDKLFGWTNVMKLGAHAEFIALPESGAFIHLPTGMSWTEAAAIPFGFGTAQYFLRKAKLTHGQRILVYGASGSVGTAAVQLAHALGATVTGVCSTRNVELVRSLGANEVLDYTKNDLSAHRDRYDVVFETVGKLPFTDCLGLVAPQGTIVLGSDLPADMLKRAFTHTGNKRAKVLTGTAGESAEDIAHFAELWSGKRIRPVIDSTYPLDRIAEAHARAESWRKVGNVVVTIP